MAELRRFEELSGELTPDQVSAWETVQAEEGWRAAARWRLLDLEQRAGRGYVSPLVIARYHGLLGHVESTLDWLERGYEGRDPRFLTSFELPFFDHLDDEPRFQALVRKLGLHR